MGSLNLPQDLAAFLQSGKQLEYDPSNCDAGRVVLLPTEQLEIQYFPMISEVPEDPHKGEWGCYLVKGISLVASCENYEPSGLILWLPLDERYALWDDSHDLITVFGPDVDWSQITQNPTRYINAHWGFDDTAPVSKLAPWLRHSYNKEQVHHALPGFPEWYELDWKRRGLNRKGVQLRFPEQIQLSIKCDADGCEISTKVKKPEESATLITGEKALLTLSEWETIKPWLEAGFWQQPSQAGGKHQGETSTSWSMTGFRAGLYHQQFRSYDEQSSKGDAVHELGKRIAKLAKLQRFDSET